MITRDKAGRQAMQGLKKLKPLHREAGELSLKYLGALNQAEARRSMLEKKNGRKWPDLPNRSSASGEAPAYQFGKMYQHISYSSTGDRMEFGDRVLPGGEFNYPAHLETVMDRPHIEPVAKKNESRLPEMLPGIVEDLRK